jgi:hypothetical protein
LPPFYSEADAFVEACRRPGMAQKIAFSFVHPTLPRRLRPRGWCVEGCPPDAPTCCKCAQTKAVERAERLCSSGLRPSATVFATRVSVRVMPTDVELECACGKLRGRALGVSASGGTRVVCYCDDCQAFARFLGGRDILDERGGTDLFQMAPSRVQLTSGADALGCVRLSSKGMHRWYCTECKTPVGNTMGPRVPFVGMIHSIMRVDRSGRSRDDVLGPPVARVNTESATPGAPVPSTASATLRAILRSVRLLAGWWLTRSGFPSPFFDEATKAPRVEPRILSEEERKALGRTPAQA